MVTILLVCQIEAAEYAAEYKGGDDKNTVISEKNRGSRESWV